MVASTLFVIGEREVSPAAAEAACAANLNLETLFDRHERGDWGDVPEWLQNDNSRAASQENYSHAIRSHYRLDDTHEFLVITARNRTKTRLMLAGEFVTREVGVQEGYGVWAEAYDYPNPLVAVEEPVVDAMLAALPHVDSAIDVGTGTGRLARKLARRGTPNVLGVDATPQMLAVARANAAREGLENVRFAHVVLGESPLPAETDSFALLTSGLMLCHLPDLRAGRAECVRVVRPGGWLILSDFHPATQGFGWRTDFINTEGVYLLPNVPNTREGYLEALTDAGCRLREVHDIALDGQPYGDLSEETMRARGWPPLCLVVLAQKNPTA